MPVSLHPIGDLKRKMSPNPENIFTGKAKSPHKPMPAHALTSKLARPLRKLHLTLVASFLASALHAQDAVKAPAEPTFPATEPQAPTSFSDSATVAQFFFGKDNLPDTFYDEVQAWKEQYHIPISIGADHWFHIDRDEHIYGDGYGVPGESGTYYYYIDFDPSLQLESDFASEAGAHVQFRFRDSGDKLRAFYSGEYWFYEAYGYLKTNIGTFKAGQIVTQFGVAWDGTWWEGVPYFDGYKFDPDYGVGWDNEWKFSDHFLLDSVAQFFFASDGVNGSIPGADAESGSGLSEENTGVIRLVPTWKFDQDQSLAWGVSGLYGGIKGASVDPGVDSRRGVWGTDLTYTWKNFSVFGEYIDAYGATNPVRYVSGGPSDHVNSARIGVSYKYGPATFHINYSHGWDHQPRGQQYVFDPGVNFQMAKNIVLYLEYVKWDVTNRYGVTSKFDDGFESIIVWNL
ncbi:MAG TPA: hypothetical protein VGG02_03855 [Chthoniobacterales bacterium]